MTTKTLAVGPHRLGYSDDGAGQPVVLLHSGGLSSRQWRWLREALATTHRVIVPDLLGYGASTPWPTGEPFDFHQDIDAIGSLVASLGEPAHLVGHSYGGLIALHVALAHPPRSVAVYEPVTLGVLDPERDRDAVAGLAGMRLTFEPAADGIDERWLSDFIGWWNGPGAWEALGEETRAAFRAVSWKLFEEVRTLAGDRTTAASFAAIGAPVLVMGGERSPMTEQRVIERLAEALPHGRLHRFPRLGHMGPVTHAARVGEVICAHVRAA